MLERLNPDSELPIAAVVPQVIAGLRAGNVVLEAEPGAGKSTGLPLALLRDSAISGKIVMLEPRRLAARGVADRLAAQLGDSVGGQVGLRMRGQTAVSDRTRLEVVTEGVLTRMLQTDPLLEGIGLVIFDEFHERSLHADLGLTLCLEVQQQLRSDLRLLLMSATLDATLLNHFLTGAEHIVCTARQHPVKITWLGESTAPLPSRVATSVRTALAEEAGDVLVFLPGVAEIEKTAKLLQPELPEHVQLHRLHGGVDSKAQRAATAPAASSYRRVILSTSIAETSITIDGIGVVIDSGLERRGKVDSSTGANRLETVTASRASASQRAGRAGRTAAGACYRLWSENAHSRRTESWQAEILRADLTPLLLELAQWGASQADQLPWLEPPPAAALSRAKDVLIRLGIWRDGKLTDHGRAVAKLPIHPRLGHMLLWAATHGAASVACKLAVLIEDSVRSRGGVDLEFALRNSLSKPQFARARQLEKKLSVHPPRNNTPSPAVLLAQAYPDWIAQARKGSDARFALSCGAGATMHDADSLAHAKWLSVAQLGGSDREARIFSACALQIDELQTYSPELFSHRNQLEWDDRNERVVAERHTVIGKLIVNTQAMTKVNKADRAMALLSGVRKRGVSCLPWSAECREWQARVQRIKSLPGHVTQLSWPAVDDATLNDQLESWLLPWLDGVSNLKALSQLRLYTILNAMLNYQQQRELDRLLPLRYTVPSGSQVLLRYAVAGNPVLAVKLQEMFGCMENPSLAKGQITLKVELLSPARRPVQVTEDLANFWVNSYSAVKKDMAGRYPKHHWPDNPLSAKPTAGTKRRPRADN